MNDWNLYDAAPNSKDQVQKIATVLEKAPPRRKLHSDTNDDLDVESKRDYTCGYIDDFFMHRAHVSSHSSLYHKGSEDQKYPEPTDVRPPNLEAVLTNVASSHGGPAFLRLFHDRPESTSQIRANLYDPCDWRRTMQLQKHVLVPLRIAERVFVITATNKLNSHKFSTRIPEMKKMEETKYSGSMI